MNMDNQVVLVTQRTLQSQYLCQLIENESDIGCWVCEQKNEEVIPDANLIALDFLDLGFDNLILLLKYAHGQGRKVVIVNSPDDDRSVALAEYPCVMGIVLDREQDPKILVQAVQAAAKGDIWLPRHIEMFLFEKFRMNERLPNHKESIDSLGLTKRELETLTLVAKGYNNAKIAQILCRSEHTIKSHLYTMYKKLNVPNRLSAANFFNTLKIQGAGQEPIVQRDSVRRNWRGDILNG